MQLHPLNRQSCAFSHPAEAETSCHVLSECTERASAPDEIVEIYLSSTWVTTWHDKGLILTLWENESTDGAWSTRLVTGHATNIACSIEDDRAKDRAMCTESLRVFSRTPAVWRILSVLSFIWQSSGKIELSCIVSQSWLLVYEGKPKAIYWYIYSQVTRCALFFSIVTRPDST